MIFALQSGRASRISSIVLPHPSAFDDFSTTFFGTGGVTLFRVLLFVGIEAAKIEIDSSILASLASIGVGERSLSMLIGTGWEFGDITDIVTFDASVDRSKDVDGNAEVVERINGVVDNNAEADDWSEDSILLSLVSIVDVVALSDVSGAVGGKIAFSPQGQQSQLKSPVIMSFRSDGRLLQLGLNL